MHYDLISSGGCPLSLPLIAETRRGLIFVPEDDNNKSASRPPKPTFLQPAALGIAALTLTAPP